MGRAWYAVHTISGHENKVAGMLERRAQIEKLWQEDIFEILIPTENQLSTRNGKRVEVKKKVFPGYILVKMNLTDDTFKVIKGTSGVTGFLGSSERPVPLEDYEVQRIIDNLERSEETPTVAFDKGDIVRVIEGPFADYTGKIEEVNSDREKIKVLISIFGRDTAVELDFNHVERE